MMKGPVKGPFFCQQINLWATQWSRDMNANSKGFTLVELMIVVAIMAIIAAVAMPLYTGYIRTARIGALVDSIATIEVFQEDFRLRTGNYQAGAYAGGPNAGLWRLVGSRRATTARRTPSLSRVPPMT